MKHVRQTHRTAIALLFAGVALPFTPAAAQTATSTDPPVVNAPPPVTAPAPPVVRAAPPPVVAPAPPVTSPAPPVAAPAPPRIAEPVADAEPAPARAETRAAPRPASEPAPRRAPARARAAAPTPAEPVPAEMTPAATPPVDAEVAPMAMPPAAPPAFETDPLAADAEPAGEAGGMGPTLPWVIGAAMLAIAAFAAFALLRRRRRREDEVHHEIHRDEAYRDEAYVDEPLTAEPEPVGGPSFSSRAAAAAAMPLAAAAPLAAEVPPSATPAHAVGEPGRAAEAVRPVASTGPAAPERISIGEPDAADVEALAAASQAPAGRPWLEFLLRPVRAGTTGDDAVVEFELTVGNTGSVPARDVRISTWMFAAGSPAESEMERMLIERPAANGTPRLEIPAGDGARVETALALPKSGLDEAVLPVVVADARYTLPDGSEGRTSASFEVGLPGDESLEPFPTDRASGLIETVEARLHGELERI